MRNGLAVSRINCITSFFSFFRCHTFISSVSVMKTVFTGTCGSFFISGFRASAAFWSSSAGASADFPSTFTCSE